MIVREVREMSFWLLCSRVCWNFSLKNTGVSRDINLHILTIYFQRSLEKHKKTTVRKIVVGMGRDVDPSHSLGIPHWGYGVTNCWEGRNHWRGWATDFSSHVQMLVRHSVFGFWTFWWSDPLKDQAVPLGPRSKQSFSLITRFRILIEVY